MPVEELGALAEAGITLLGENRAQDLVAKADAYPGRFTWDFIGALQSRKVRQLVPYVRYIQSVASDSALAQLGRHAPPDIEVLVEVNVAGEASKSGIAPAELGAFIERCPVTVVGLMTMPPFAEQAEASRRYFAALRELAAAASTSISCRWERARTTSSRCRRARRLCVLARASIPSAAAARHNPGREIWS